MGGLPEDEAIPYFAVRDCFQYVGIARRNIPNGPSVRARVRGVEMCSFWKENDPFGGEDASLGVQANNVRFLADALRPELALSASGGIERLCYFLIKNSGLLLMDTVFVSPQKFDSQRYIERFARSPRAPQRCTFCMQSLPTRSPKHSPQHR